MKQTGFTLIELMIVTVLLGILAMIAFPVYRDLRTDAVEAALREQLRTLAEAQQMYFLEHDVYSGDGGLLDYRPASDLQLEVRAGGSGSSSGDEEEDEEDDDDAPSGPGPDEGWSARLTDTDYGVRCAVFFGRTDPFEPAALEGDIACDEGG